VKSRRIGNINVWKSGTDMKLHPSLGAYAITAHDSSPYLTCPTDDLPRNAGDPLRAKPAKTGVSIGACPVFNA
jgi:hypothetical protein